MSKTLRVNNLKTGTATNAKISVFAICVEAIIYLLLYNLHDRTLNLLSRKSVTSYRFFMIYNNVFRWLPFMADNFSLNKDVRFSNQNSGKVFYRTC